MKKQKFEFLLDELKLQTNFAILSINHFNNTWEKLFNYEDENLDRVTITYEFWYYLQNYVIALGNISKLLFATKNKYETVPQFKKRLEDRKFFLGVLKVKANTILRDKKMRNLLEHIDENLEKFSDKSASIIANKNIGPSNAIQIGNDFLFEKDEDNLRNFITDRNELILFGKRLNVEKTFQDVIELRDKIISIEKQLKNGELDNLFCEN